MAQTTMKTITIIGADEASITDSLHKVGKDVVAQGAEDMSVSDGYHTFDELYDHRIELFMALCQAIGPRVGWSNIWRSLYHSDGTTYKGWFVLGIFKEPGKQITYHLPVQRWKDAEFAETLDRAPEWDGHQAYDVLDRLRALV